MFAFCPPHYVIKQSEACKQAEATRSGHASNDDPLARTAGSIQSHPPQYAPTCNSTAPGSGGNVQTLQQQPYHLLVRAGRAAGGAALLSQHAQQQDQESAQQQQLTTDHNRPTDHSSNDRRQHQQLQTHQLLPTQANVPGPPLQQHEASKTHLLGQAAKSEAQGGHTNLKRPHTSALASLMSAYAAHSSLNDQQQQQQSLQDQQQQQQQQILSSSISAVPAVPSQQQAADAAAELLDRYQLPYAASRCCWPHPALQQLLIQQAEVLTDLADLLCSPIAAAAAGAAGAESDTAADSEAGKMP